MTLEDLNRAEAGEFISVLATIFEHSPWVAEAVVDQRPFGDVAALHGAMVAAVDAAGRQPQLTLIRAHPDLAGKAARSGALTAESTSEQKGAGLDRLSDGEFDEFHRLNNAYTTKYTFPFILAVRGHDKHSILASFRSRLDNSFDDEIAEALKQIALIAQFRLQDLLATKGAVNG